VRTAASVKSTSTEMHSSSAMESAPPEMNSAAMKTAGGEMTSTAVKSATGPEHIEPASGWGKTGHRGQTDRGVTPNYKLFGRMLPY